MFLSGGKVVNVMILHFVLLNEFIVLEIKEFI